jgi:hypothetical protein
MQLQVAAKLPVILSRRRFIFVAPGLAEEGPCAELSAEIRDIQAEAESG